MFLLYQSAALNENLLNILRFFTKTLSTCFPQGFSFIDDTDDIDLWDPKCGKTWGKFLREKANASQSPPYTISGLTATEELYWMQMQCCWSATTLLLRGKNSHKHFTIESRGGKYFVSCRLLVSLFLIFTIIHINVSVVGATSLINE